MVQAGRLLWLCRQHLYIYVYICIKGSGTYPFTLLSKRFLTAEKHQEKHKCISKDGAFCCGYSGYRQGRFFRWASSLFLNIFTEESVTTSAGRPFHIFTTLWLRVNLRRSSLDRFFRSFSGCPRSLEVSAKPCKALPIHVLCFPSSASVGDGGVWHLTAYGYRDQ